MALLQKRKDGMLKIHKTQYLVTILSDTPHKLYLDEPNDSFGLIHLNYDINEGYCLGDIEEHFHEVITDKDLIRLEMIKVGNDGEFFDLEDH